MTRQIKLGAFLIGNGHHVAAWRHPDADLAGNPFELYRRSAETSRARLVRHVFSLPIRSPSTKDISRMAPRASTASSR